MKPDYKFLQGGGKMGELIRSIDWSVTSIGAVENWPIPLKIATGIMLSTPFPMYIAWGEDYIQLYNDGYRPILGSTKHPQAMGISTRETFAEIWHIIGSMFDGVMEGNAVGFPNFMLPLERNGYVEECFFDFSYSPISDEDGNIGGVLVTVIEITEKVLRLKELNQAKQDIEAAKAETDAQRDQLKKFFMDAPAGICVLGGENFVFELVNPAYQKLLPNRDLINRPVFEALPELIGQPLQLLLEKVYRTGVSERVIEDKIPIAEFDGGPLVDRYFNFNYQARFDHNGIADGIVVFVFEVTDIVSAKRQLIENANLLQDQMNAIPQIAWTNSLNGEVDFYNQKWFDYTGLTFEQTKAWGWKEVIHPNDLDYNLQKFKEILQGTTGGEFEIREKSADGEFRWHTIRIMPIKDTEGNIKQWIGTATDIHELKEANELLANARQELEMTINALSASKANFSGIILQAPVAMGLFVGEEMKLEVINDKFLELWDKDRSILGMTLAEALPEIVCQPYPQIMLDVFHTGKPYFGDEAKVDLFRRGRLETGYYNFINQPFIGRDGKITGIIVVAIEVTDQVNARNELERVYEQARLSKEAAQLGTFDMDLQNGTMEWDERCRTLFGISHHNEVTYEGDFKPGLHPEDKDRIVQIIDNAFIKSKTGGKYDVEYRTIGVEDQKLRWVRAKGQVYFDNNEVPIRFIGSVLDITEQKQDEIRKNDFIGMVSHELKTPLTSLTAIIQVLNVKMKGYPDSFIPAALEKANSQVRKMNNMITGFLNISRLEAGKIEIIKTTFDMESLIGEAIAESSLIITSHNIKFERCGSLMVKADYDKIGSVITNLISNAVKYSPKGKEIEVKCTLFNNQAVVSVKDEGMGIKPQDKEHLFERYYRVQSNHTQNISGFGIGLYLCAEIVDRHKGNIWVESESGKGSTFYFSIPMSPPE